MVGLILLLLAALAQAFKWSERDVYALGKFKGTP
jgi:hypothetical protein